MLFVCYFAVTPQSYLILASGLLIIGVRGLIGSILYKSPGAFVVGAVAAVILYILAKKEKFARAVNYEVLDYSYAELAIDCAVLGFLLFLASKLI